MRCHLQGSVPDPVTNLRALIIQLRVRGQLLSGDGRKTLAPGSTGKIVYRQLQGGALLIKRPPQSYLRALPIQLRVRRQLLSGDGGKALAPGSTGKTMYCPLPSDRMLALRGSWILCSASIRNSQQI